MTAFRHGLNVVVLDAQHVAYESPIFINPYPQKRVPLLQDMELRFNVIRVAIYSRE